jgi:hypothetical protein|tara:strand:+ start:45 stop:641 length:597 start_codon:yes stop_codon:yes gene_type:complete
MKAKETLNKVRTLLGMDVSLETRKLENGTMLESEDFSKGNEVFILAEDSEKIALPKGDYLLDDGLTLYVQEEGIINDIRETLAEGDEEDAEERREDKGEADVEDWAGMEKRIKNLEDAVADLKAKVDNEQDEIEDAVDKEDDEERKIDAKKEIELNEIEQVAHSPERTNTKRQTFGQTRRYANSTQQRVFEALFGDNK